MSDGNFCPYLVTLFQDLLLEKINRYDRKSVLSSLKAKCIHTLVQLILIEFSSFTPTSHLVDLGYTIKFGQTTRDIVSTGLVGKPILLGLLFFLFSSTPRKNVQDLVPSIFLLFRILGCAATPEFLDLVASDAESAPIHFKRSRDSPDP